jgi:hypothetical protein
MNVGLESGFRETVYATIIFQIEASIEVYIGYVMRRSQDGT